MPLSIDIRLPRNHEPVFPDLCVMCLEPGPAGRYQVSVRSWKLVDLWVHWAWLARKPVRCEVPACHPCRKAAMRGKWFRFGVLATAVLFCMAVIDPWLKTFGLSKGWRRLVLPIELLLLVVPGVVWMLLRPPPFDITVGSDHVTYEFANPDYAVEFALANGVPPDRIGA
jgi:hypothetical protein